MPSIESSPLRANIAATERQRQLHVPIRRFSPPREYNPRVRLIMEDSRDDTALSQKYGRLSLERKEQSPSSGLAIRQPNIQANEMIDVSYVTWAPNHQGDLGWRRQRFNQEVPFRPPEHRIRPVLVREQAGTSGRQHVQRYHDPRYSSHRAPWPRRAEPYNWEGRRPTPPFPTHIEIPLQAETANNPRPTTHQQARSSPPTDPPAEASVSTTNTIQPNIDSSVQGKNVNSADSSKSIQTHQPNKRQLSPRSQFNPLTHKKTKGFDKLDMLCSATLEIGELHENPNGCSCPKSKCIALYCDCFKAGRRCNPSQCSCTDCKNTIAESGPNGARSKAIRSILARNPRAFTTAGMGNPLSKLPPGEIACNCVRSRCLKLYCSCFRNGKFCRPNVCSCVGKYSLDRSQVLTNCKDCHNTDNDKGDREMAIQMILEKRPDAFTVKEKEKGQGCACKNNRCIRKYCECFRNNLHCTSKCSCRACENKQKDQKPEQEEKLQAQTVASFDVNVSAAEQDKIKNEEITSVSATNPMQTQNFQANGYASTKEISTTADTPGQMKLKRTQEAIEAIANTDRL